MVIFLPLMILVEVDTDLKLPDPPARPPAPLLKDEKEAMPPLISGKELKPAEEQRSEEDAALLPSEVRSTLRTYPDRTPRNSLESLRTQRGTPPSCSDSRPCGDCDQRRGH